MADFKVQRGVCTIASGQSSNTITAGADYTAPAALSKAFIRITAANYFGCQGGTNTSFANEVCAWIDDPGNLLTSITFKRGGTDTRSLSADWEIIEYTGPGGGANEFVVRDQGAVTYGSGATTKDTGTVAGVVTDADIAVFITGQGTTTTASGLQTVLSHSQWVSASQVGRFTRVGGVLGTVSYAVVEWTGSNWSVQRVTHTYSAAGAEETETITDVGAVTRAWVHGQTFTAENLNYAFSHEIWLSAATTVSFKLDSQATPASATAVAWVIANSQTGTGAANCNRYTGTYTTSGTLNVTVTAVPSMDNASVAEISQTNAQNTPSPGRDQGSYRLTTTTNVAINHTGSINTTTYRFGVFEWPTAPSSGSAGSQRGLERGIDRGLNRGLA